MTNSELFLAVRNIVITATGLAQVIKAEQGAPAPAGAYASIKTTIGRNQYGQAIVRRQNTPLVASPIGNVHDVQRDVSPQMIARVSVNFYRDNAHDYAERLVAANKRSDISRLLYQYGIGWQKAEGPTDLTALQSNEYESRAQVLLFLMYEQTHTETVNAIYSAEISVENADGDVIQTATQNIEVN